MPHDEPVTCLLPCRNAMPFLGQALAALAAQTHRPLHVLAWDNGSTDGTVQELRRWIPQRLPGRVIADQPLGLGASLAKLVESAQTELCARVDGDDVCEPQRLERQVRFLADHRDVAVVGANLRFIDESGREMSGAWQVGTADADIRWRLRFCNAMNHPTVVFRRSAILAAGNYPDTPTHDYELWVRVALKHALANLSDVLVRYRQHPKQFGKEHGAQMRARHREVQGRFAAGLFPGLTPDEALRLVDVLCEPQAGPVTLHDCRCLVRAAVAAGQAAAGDPAYFRRTELCRRQVRDLLLRWAKARPGGMAMHRLWRWARDRRVAAILSSPSDAGARAA